MNNASKLIGGLLIGGAIGTVAGILIAPESGKRTRGRLMKESKHMKKRIDHTLTETADALKKEYNRKLDQFASNGKESIDNVKDKIRI